MQSAVAALAGFVFPPSLDEAPVTAIFHSAPNPFGMAPNTAIALLLLAVAAILASLKGTGKQ